MNLPSFSHELVVAARLADPEARKQLGFDQHIDWTSVVQILTSSKVPLVGMAQDPALQGCPLLDCPVFQEAAANEAAVWSGLRAEYEAVRAGWLHQGVQNVAIKSTSLRP